MITILNLLVDDWVAVSVLSVVLTYVFYRFAKTDSVVSSASKKPYACGLSVSPDLEIVPSPSFYKTIVSVFRMGAIKKLHKDDLSTYLIWMLFGVVFVSCYLFLFG
ncbi:MAG: hypothetical protein GQ477_01525 [Nanohaloarchaea archaeon]|nr:hypothetical protein [Candidatus Nanohaloarchaea archaeon]